MRLFIAEKPTLAKAIFEGLGGDPKTQRKQGYFENGNDIVTWCVGHLLEQSPPEHQWKLEYLPIKSEYPPKMRPIGKTKAQFKVVQELIKKADRIVNASDPDEEGNLLCDEILTYCHNTKPVERLLVADLNLGPVKHALANMQPNENFYGWTQSALARSIGDLIFGFNMSQAYTLKAREIGYSGTFGIGRVQTVVLGMINERTLANQSHTESFFYHVYADFSFDSGTVKARYLPTESNNVDEQNRLIDDSEAKSIAQTSNHQKALIIDSQTKQAKTLPPRPYDLSTLQQLCAKKWGYSAKKTLDICQSLYETHKVLTYPRTDNRFLGDSHLEQRVAIFKNIAESIPELSSMVADADLSLKHSTFNSSKISAHHAIIPTLTTAKGLTLTKDEQNIYELVARSFIALFYPASVRDKTEIIIELANQYHFKANQTQLKIAGWEVLYKDDIEAEKPIEGVDLTTLKHGRESKASNPTIEKGKTKPPKYHDEASLLAFMKKAGKLIKDPELRAKFEAKDKGDRDSCGSIGTEATRASILDTIKSRKDLVQVVKKKGYKQKVWVTTQLGQEFCAMLPGEFTAPDISAIWSQHQLAIKNGEMTVKQFLEELDIFVEQHVNNVKSNGVNITVEKFDCPNCEDGHLIKRNGTNGGFWACNRYPECKTSFPDKSGKPDTAPKAKPKVSEFNCPLCQKPLVRRKGKSDKGKPPKYFYGCSGYPECKASYQEQDNKPKFT
ncbi:DNA topoisomerase [Photobacterium damselae]|uniref:DNA topoisomerase n=1 Tax=Photobacterium damselae TaxID=38293 RepID=UPI0010FDA2EF|nr:DNA topoisomerase [Photobacterium damselae]KAB1511988.1 DNA topoisomerase III [Photobacterium damselae subsp. damselae]TLS69582.1 DNA topoisomerase III [Photobacterium damselae subsp. damselae]TLS74576.1 DNA topoisomerase III [Photobacterium damselae subsp. damselae]TLS84139.1 DNA topoisomerase III [Photobacterium damselae subsp. damselae]